MQLMTGIMKDLTSTSRQHFVISRLRFSLVISQKSKDVMFELDCVNVNDNAKKKVMITSCLLVSTPEFCGISG